MHVEWVRDPRFKIVHQQLVLAYNTARKKNSRSFWRLQLYPKKPSLNLVFVLFIFLEVNYQPLLLRILMLIHTSPKQSHTIYCICLSALKYYLLPKKCITDYALLSLFYEGASCDLRKWARKLTGTKIMKEPHVCLQGFNYIIHFLFFTQFNFLQGGRLEATVVISTHS